eukprot:m.23377 g.23377  ORF g.23377 m.23377 type:complete len:454 (-) comp14193_c0_seq1:224-1585(-)
MATKEWARNGSFMKKPATGWLHDDTALTHGDGVYYPVKYVGSIVLSRSMRDLNFDDRTMVTREAITLCSEAAGIKTERRRVVKNVVRQCLQDDPVAKMLNTKLTISTRGIALVVIESDQTIANHIMPNISFATGGDVEDFEIIGYVAKDHMNKRECHVFDCGHMAADVIATVGQAFELRFKSFLKKGNDRAPAPIHMPQTYGDSAAVYDTANSGSSNNIREDQTYDDLPGSRGGAIRNISNYGDDAYGQNPGYNSGSTTYDSTPGSRPQVIGQPQSMYGEDVNDPTYDTAQSQPGLDGFNQGNDVIYDAAGQNDFDYDDTMAMDDTDASLLQLAPKGPEIDRPLEDEQWFHHNLDRNAAEQYLRGEGDFLVRESTQAFGQYILSVMQDGFPKHLLLVDPNGIVRTRDLRFESPSHLINYHVKSQIPILSRGSTVYLGAPVIYSVDFDLRQYGE